MKHLLANVRLGAALTASLSLAPAGAMAAQQGVALSQIASDCGYRYAYIGAEQAVVLTRQGASIKVRPGEGLYEYNDREVPVDGGIPYYANGDIYVPYALASRLHRYASCDSTHRETTPGGTTMTFVNPHTGALTVESATKIQTFTAHQIPDQYQIAIAGTATPNARVAITLRAVPAADLPEVVVNRTRVRADEKGNFALVIPTASLYYPGTIARLTAETDSGDEKSIPVAIQPPNHNRKVPSDSESDLK